MSRAFNGASDFITFAAGGAASLQNGAMSLVYLVRLNATHAGGLYDGRAVGIRRLGMNPFSDNEIYVNIIDQGFQHFTYTTLVSNWAIIGITKTAGASAFRTHIYNYTAATWTHAAISGQGTLGNGSGTVDSILFGSFDGGQFLNANVAAAGFWTGTALSDANFEASTGFQTSLANWFNLTPSVLWRFNQASVATPVTDLMSSGADQTAIIGTTVSAEDPPGFSYSITSVISGTGSTDLGTLDAAASGGVTVNGTGTADLGVLSAAATGDVLSLIQGTGLANLGSLSALATTPEPPDPDQFVSVLMNQLLACLCDNVAIQPNPPQHCCFRVGTEIAHDAGILQDLCCEGIAYVSLGDTFPSSDSFPEADIVRQANSSCAPTTWAQEFQVGIIRCVPTGDQFLPPSCIDWNAASRQNVIDAQTLRRVACCMRTFVVQNSGVFFGMSLVIDRQIQGNPLGGCVERTMKLTAQFPNCDC